MQFMEGTSFERVSEAGCFALPKSRVGKKPAISAEPGKLSFWLKGRACELALR
jgi:hypothetical protein